MWHRPTCRSATWCRYMFLIRGGGARALRISEKTTKSRRRRKFIRLGRAAFRDIFEKCIFEKCNFLKMHFRKMHLNFQKIFKFLAGSFSAVSKRNFARKYAFDNIFQFLQDVHTFAPLRSPNFSKKSVWKINNFRETLIQQKIFKSLRMLQNVANFQKIQLDNLVAFEKCWKMRI